MLTFQQIILTLQSYWADQGCALLQPYDMEVGAGTSHTATFLRSGKVANNGAACSAGMKWLHQPIQLHSA